MVFNARTVIRIVFVENRYGVRPPDLTVPEVAPAWSCTGCGMTQRDEPALMNSGNGNRTRVFRLRI